MKRAKKGDRRFSSLPETLLEKNSVAIYRIREKCAFRVQVEGFAERSFIGSIWVGRKRKDYNSGRHGLAPTSFTIQCQPSIEKSGKPQRGQILYQRIPTPLPAPKIVL